MPLTEKNADKALRATLNILAPKGIGYYQTNELVAEVQKALKPKTAEEEQIILRAFKDLFTSGDLCEGYDLANPELPFMHPTPKGIKGGLLPIA
jgi:hypothetical protein